MISPTSKSSPKQIYNFIRLMTHWIHCIIPLNTVKLHKESVFYPSWKNPKWSRWTHVCDDNEDGNRKRDFHEFDLLNFLLAQKTSIHSKTWMFSVPLKYLHVKLQLTSKPNNHVKWLKATNNNHSHAFRFVGCSNGL